ncbi:unnamed protein product [Clonostachys rosea]|uniref:PH domain-containing protein n=1 Tax=Bionectria ochroleuca TaxID=29856 RepID=A0ABY6US94_BIOOC|nr:unnamed protein product [Clonostachys rosea]
MSEQEDLDWLSAVDQHKKSPKASEAFVAQEKPRFSLPPNDINASPHELSKVQRLIPLHRRHAQLKSHGVVLIVLVIARGPAAATMREGGEEAVLI